MLPALLATILFSLSAVSATRTARTMGGTEANFWRLSIATVMLGAWTYFFGVRETGGAFAVFFISGCVGFGLGDVALFQALPRLGSRLSILLVHCLAAPFAAFTEWAWIGTKLSASEVAAAVIILAGVAVALAPGEHLAIPRRTLIQGVIAGAIAAIGQGGGAVLSRVANQIARTEGISIDGLSAAYQRILGGVLVSGIALLVVKRAALARLGEPEMSPRNELLGSREKWRRVRGWILFNALAGPTLGVGCYQWALKSKGTGVVLPVVAITPLMVVPFAAWLEGERPSKRSLIGGVIAVAGAVLLAMGSR
jgi:drug/metabolite transporter (DMT)-like permease